MKKEVELKFRVNDFGPIRKKLRSLGAKLVWAGREENWFYDTKAHALQKRDTALRIKTMGDTRLTLKEGQPEHGGIKVAHEYQIAIPDAHRMGELLRRIGFLLVLHYRKRREQWKLPGAEVTLDTLTPKIKFVEIEAPRVKIHALAKQLGLDFTKSTTKTYIQLLGEHRKQK